MKTRRTVVPDARRSPRFSGIATFCRYPRLEDVSPENSPVDWAIFGVPYDTGVTFRPGARFGPRAIRDASQYVKRYSIEHDVDVCDALSLADAGDAPVEPYDLRATMESVTDFARGLGDPRVTRLMAIGGDHSIAYANIRATHERLGRPKGGLALFHLDSHLDTTDEVFGSKWGHASPFARAIEEGLIDPRAMLSIGIKGPLNSGADLERARSLGVSLITGPQWRADPAAGRRAVEAFVRSLADRPAYVTIDIDVVDPAFAPGTGTPSVGGLTSAETLEIVRAARGINVAGGDVVEVLPDRDVSQITALLAAHLMFEVLCLSAVHAANRR